MVAALAGSCFFHCHGSSPLSSSQPWLCSRPAPVRFPKALLSEQYAKGQGLVEIGEQEQAETTSSDPEFKQDPGTV